MIENIVTNLSKQLNINPKQIRTTLELLSDGATIPFIARYRKEMTGSLDENQIEQIKNQYDYLENLLARKETVIKLIDEKGMLTEELKKEIMACEKLVDVEDIYLPFKEKKKTKASEAIKMGLEPLAKEIMTFPMTGDFPTLCKLVDVDETIAMENARYIISEIISDNHFYRKFIRNYIYNNGYFYSKRKKDSIDEYKVYEMYYDFKEKIKDAKSYRVLAMNRGDKEKVLTINLEYDFDYLVDYLKYKVIKNQESFVCTYVCDCIKDALKRLILPSIEREIRSESTELADNSAIEEFKNNLENLLLTRPLSGYRVMGFDPAFRTGCKLACLDESGNVLHIDVIYPHEPKNDIENAKNKLVELINKYKINLIAIGNGTASRESEMLVVEVIKNLKDVYYLIVSEAGASVYSASKEAQKEFPDLEVQERSAISIGRRAIDPLSELVKIDPQSIGVGLYQHDVNNKKLIESLNFTVTKVVNKVGVNINTASAFILGYIAGLTKSNITKILKYKENHVFTNREQVKKFTNDKSYEQAIGFLRINSGSNVLDNTGIHPESYELTMKVLEFLKLNTSNIKDSSFKEKLKRADIRDLAIKFNSDEYTISDIIKELISPGLDPREEKPKPILKADILTLEDLKTGMELNGTVRNVTSFGAFVDIGLKNDGLLHISKMSNKFISDPNEVVSVGDIITCYVDEILIDKKKVALSLLKK